MIAMLEMNMLRTCGAVSMKNDDHPFLFLFAACSFVVQTNGKERGGAPRRHGVSGGSEC